MRNANRNNDARFITQEMATQRYNLCRNKVVRVAKEAGAFCKIGTSARIDTLKLDAYFSNVLSKQS